MAAAYSLAWDVPLHGWNTFHLDARARCLATVHDAAALPALLAEPALRNLPLMVLGAGSNVLFATERFDGCLVHLQSRSARIVGDDGDHAHVQVDAGLAAFAALIIGRALWLGDPLSIPLLRLQNGALILFAFFMISDPKSTPDGFWPRTMFAAGTATLAYYFIYHTYNADGLFLALAVACLVRPLIEKFDAASPYRWTDRPHFPISSNHPSPAE